MTRSLATLAAATAASGLVACSRTPAELTLPLQLPAYADGPLPPGLPRPASGQADPPERLEGLRDAHYEAFRRDRSDPGVRLRLVLLQLATDKPQSAVEDLADAPADPRLAYLRAVALARHAQAQPHPLDEEDALARALDDLERIRWVPGFELPARYLRALIRCELGDFGPAEQLLAEGGLSAADAAALAAAADDCGWGHGHPRRWRQRHAARVTSSDATRADALAHSFPLRALWFLNESLDAAWAAACSGRWAARDSVLESVREQAGYLPGDGRLAAPARSEVERMLRCTPDQLRALNAVLAEVAAARASSRSAEWAKLLRATADLPARASAAGMDRWAADIHWGRAWAWQNRHRDEEALAELRSMRAITARLDDIALQWTAANELRARLADLGRVGESLVPLEEMRALDRRFHLDRSTLGVSEGFYRHQIGDQLGAFKAWAEACRHARRQLQELAELRSRESLAFHALSTRDLDRARRYAEQVLASRRGRTADELSPEMLEAFCYALVDRGHALAQDPTDDLTALEAAIDSCRHYGFMRAAVEGRLVLARALAARHQFVAALAVARTAQTEAAANAWDLHWRSIAVLGETQMQTGNVAAAAEQFEVALREVEQTQAGLSESEARASFLLSARGLVDHYIDALLAQPHGAARCWTVDERGRQHWIRELRSPARPAPVSQIGRAKDDLRALQHRLGPGAVVLKYRVQSERTLLWIVTTDTIRLEELPVGEATLAHQIENWRQVILNGSESPFAAELYTTLVAPADAAITPDCEVVIVPDGVLALVPFHAMRRDDSWLLQLHPVKYAVSGRAWVHLHDRAKARAEQPGREPAFRGVGYGGPMRAAGDGAILPHAELEVTEAAALFARDHARVLLGQAATPAAVLRLLEDGTLLHIVCHTGLDQFGRPALALSPASDPDDPEAGLVTAAQFSHWPLSGFDLVVLSACATATDPSAGSSPAASGSAAVSPLGGVHSLGTAAFVGGAGAVIASLWSVEDAPTGRLMLDLYRQMFALARTPAEALRAAQLSLASGPNASQHQRAWAAFCVYGP